MYNQFGQNARSDLGPNWVQKSSADDNGRHLVKYDNDNAMDTSTFCLLDNFTCFSVTCCGLLFFSKSTRSSRKSLDEDYQNAKLFGLNQALYFHHFY